MNCPDGCPCPVYECPAISTTTSTITTTTADPTITSVLVLNTKKLDNAPLLINLNENADTSVNFKIENNVYAYASCGVQFKGEFYVYGSSVGDMQQIAKVTDCALKRVASLPFTFRNGACAATMDEVYLCFDWQNGDQKECHVGNEWNGPFSTTPDSTHAHKSTRSAASESKYD